MIKVLVVDDENKTREFIAKLIRSFGLELDVIAQGENVETAIEAIHEHKPNLVILDIQMPDGTGFDVLKRIESINFEVIFVTAHQEFAIKAIKFSALDYILKPVDPEELRESIENAIQSISSKKDELQYDALHHNLVPNQKRKLVLKTQESVFVVELDNIIRCEADKNYTFFFLTNGKKILVSKTLKDFETLLSGYNFFRIQQSHLININFVDRYDKFDGGSVIMKDGASVPLSQAKKEMFFQILENL